MPNITTDRKVDRYPIAYDRENKKKLYVDMETDGEREYRSNLIEMSPYLQNDDQRIAIYISAPSGAGKSYEAARLVKEISKLKKFENNLPVLMTLNTEVDPAYKHIPFHRLNAFDDDVYEQPVSFYANTIMVFDDYESGEKTTVKAIKGLIDKCLQRGRKLNIAVIVITHQTMNYALTRDIIFECETYILYPSANINSVLKFLKAYMDFSNKELQIIKKEMGSHRIAYFRKSVPRVFITKNLIKLL